MISASSRWRNLGVAAGGTAAVLFAIFDLYQWAVAYSSDHFHNDFTFYFAAARVGLLNGWNQIYNLQLQQLQLNAMASGITVADLARYISPPPVAWLATPFTTLPYPVAYWTWSAMLLAALLVTWLLAAPSTGWARVIFLVAAIGWLPVIYGLQLGQPALLVALGVAASYALLRTDHPWWAGIALAAIVFKPQLAFLVPFALFTSGRYRLFIACAVTLSAFAVASALEIGRIGIADYLSRLGFASTVPANRELTLAFFLGDAARPVQIVIAAWTLFLAFRLRNRGHEWPYAVGIVGGMLATPYVHLDDLMMLGLAAWLVLRADPVRWAWTYVLVLVIVVEGEPIWGPAPVLIGDLVALALLSAAAFTARDAQTLPQIGARPLELRPKQ